jgi:hypothetical protein
MIWRAGVVRTQIQFEDSQYRALKACAAARSVSMAEVVRESVDALLRPEDRERRWALLWQAVGSCRDPQDEGSVAVRHDDFLTTAYRGE